MSARALAAVIMIAVAGCGDNLSVPAIDARHEIDAGSTDAARADASPPCEIPDGAITLLGLLGTHRIGAMSGLRVPWPADRPVALVAEIEVSFDMPCGYLDMTHDWLDPTSGCIVATCGGTARCSYAVPHPPFVPLEISVTVWNPQATGTEKRFHVACAWLKVGKP